MEQQEMTQQQETLEQKKEEASNLGWYLFIGCMFTGMGIGKLFDHTDTGILIGMGIGFMAYAVVSFKKGSNS